jgi:hypothetical protein
MIQGINNHDNGFWVLFGFNMIYAHLRILAEFDCIAFFLHGLGRKNNQQFYFLNKNNADFLKLLYFEIFISKIRHFKTLCHTMMIMHASQCQIANPVF